VRSNTRVSEFAIAFRNTALAIFFVGLPLLLVAVAVSPYMHNFGYDFKIFRHAGVAYLHGRSPYPPPDLKVLARQHSFVYPAPMALLFVPFAYLPVKLGSFLFCLAMAVATAAMMRVLGVRDLRLYTVPFILLPVELGIRLGTISPLLGLLTAALWRYRDRWKVAGLLLAAIIVAKLFLAPLAVWLVVTRRWRAALLGSALAVVTTLAAWAPIEFAGFRDYWRVLSLLATGEAAQSFSVVSLGLVSGLSTHTAHVVSEVLAVVLVGAAVAVALRVRSGLSDFTAFTLTIGAALAASPIVWNHYFILLLIPVAIVAPRLSPIWFLMFALWVVPPQSAHRFAPIAVAVIVPAIVLAWTIALARRAAADGLDVSRPPTFG
jgi:hypothetical protein